MPYLHPKSIALSCSLTSLAIVTNPANAEDAFSFDTVVAVPQIQKKGETDGSMSVIKEESIQKTYESVDEVFTDTIRTSQCWATRFANQYPELQQSVLTNVDGVRQPKALSFGFLSSSRHFIDPNTLKQVKSSGPASSLYGSDALGSSFLHYQRSSDIFKDEGDGIGGSTNLDDGSNKGFSKS